MPNISYCRFHNTYNDLRDCLDYLDDPELSDAEDKARAKLIKLCKQIADDFADD